MGSNNVKPKPAGMLGQQMSCTDNLMCQNIDSRRSIPGKDPVLVCPDATCNSGSCDCGKNCTRDPYTGTCCKSIEERVTKTAMGEEKTYFCIEGPDPVLPNSEGFTGSYLSDQNNLL